jgi:hypothetical protein
MHGTTMRYFDFYDSPHGQILLVASDAGLSGVYFDGQKYFPETPADWKRDARHAPLKQAKRELAEYFAGKRKGFEVALSPEGTPFQRSVWKAIATVGFGRFRAQGQTRYRGERAPRGKPSTSPPAAGTRRAPPCPSSGSRRRGALTGLQILRARSSAANAIQTDFSESGSPFASRRRSG